MKTHRSAIITICAFILVFASFIAIAGTSVLDDLSSSKIGNLPKLWRTWPMQRPEAAKVYSVQEENGMRYIKAFDDQDISQQIFLNFDWQIENKPYLSWKWRATTLPLGARENDDATNDSACGVYVIVGRYEGHAIKYVWSASLSPGTIVSRRDGKLKIKVIDSGGSGKWVNHKVNVASDYEALFGRKLSKNPSGIAILTDGNAVHKPSGCDYADFAISE